jgi:hypothetical protein
MTMDIRHSADLRQNVAHDVNTSAFQPPIE